MKSALAVIVSIMFSGMMIVAVGCGGVDSQAEKEAVKAVLMNNLKALQEEDLGGYLATLDRESPGYEQMELLVPKIFEIYELEHEIESLEVLDISGQEASVRTVQTAIRLVGPESYRNNRTTTVHTLKKRDGVWKLSETRQEAVDYLE